MPIIRDKEALFLHILGYLIELRDDYSIELTFVHTASLKWELLKKIENELDFFTSVRFFNVPSSTINSCQYSVAIL